MSLDLPVSFSLFALLTGKTGELIDWSKLPIDSVRNRFLERAMLGLLKYDTDSTLILSKLTRCTGVVFALQLERVFHAFQRDKHSCRGCDLRLTEMIGPRLLVDRRSALVLPLNVFEVNR